MLTSTRMGLLGTVTSYLLNVNVVQGLMLLELPKRGYVRGTLSICYDGSVNLHAQPEASSNSIDFDIESKNGNRNMIRCLFHGGDNMLGRACQLTFPINAPGEEDIRDSCTAAHYLHMCLNHPSGQRPDSEYTLDEIRKQNAQNGSYLWGDSVKLSISPPPDIRLLNLETAVTRTIDNTDVPTWKGIKYHMHVDNLHNIIKGFVDATYSAENDDDDVVHQSPVIVSLANNHVLDYGRLAFDKETLPAFERLSRSFGIDGLLQTIGVGRDFRSACKPAIVEVEQCRIEAFGFASACSGTPNDWWATNNRSGLVGLPAINSHVEVEKAIHTCKQIFELHGSYEKRQEESNRSKSLIRVVSIHWGPNWAYKGEGRDEISARQEFAHRLIDECHVDVIYGHSSHHIRGIETYKNKLILYGAGDIINDYEGFENPGEEKYITMGGIFLVDLDSESGDFLQLRVIPTFMNRLRLERFTTTPQSAIWKPRQNNLERNPNKLRSFADFINAFSKRDAVGGAGKALILEYAEDDSQVDGPLLFSKRILT
jgi:poly-gamma-glutamate capsule biosynthesis protein CapA/YwtB (metallophosphatase superfamily)